MDDIELIKSKVNVVDLIQEYLPLKKSGINFKANCPFHQEKTPSFMVSPERQIWHCFGCQKGGDIFKFVMEKEGLDFREALEMLAQKAGVTLKKTNLPKDNYLDRLYEANQKAAQFYHYLLTEHKLGKKALDYLKNRGLTLETIKQFNLGYAPQNWEILVKFLEKRGFEISVLLDSGLAVASNRGGYDRFRGRIMFPLADVRGRILGFSGRVLGDELPKYINTPQTKIFDKSRFLLGLNLSKGVIKEKNEAIIVEGEMDFLMSFQAGVKNVVASKGTALTEAQVEELKKYASTILLCFDTDLAGDAASRRGIEIADKAGLNIKVIEFDEADSLSLRKSKDPAELIKKDVSLWEKAAKEAVPIYDYYLKSVEGRFNPKQAIGKRQIFAELLPIWSKISDSITREHYIEKLAAFLQVKEDFVRKELEKYHSFAGPQKYSQVLNTQSEVASAPAKNITFDRREMLEQYLIALLLHQPDDLVYIPNFPETLFTQEELKQVYVLLVLFLDSISFKSRSFKITEFIKTMPEEFVDLVDRLNLLEIDTKLKDEFVWQREMDLVVSELKKMLIKTSLEKLSLQIKNAQEFDKMEILETLNRKFRDLSVKLKNL